MLPCRNSVITVHVLYIQTIVTVSLQPSKSISTLQSFERTPVDPPQQKYKQQQMYGTPTNITPTNTGSKSKKVKHSQQTSPTLIKTTSTDMISPTKGLQQITPQGT